MSTELLNQLFKYFAACPWFVDLSEPEKELLREAVTWSSQDGSSPYLNNTKAASFWRLTYKLSTSLLSLGEEEAFARKWLTWLNDVTRAHLANARKPIGGWW